MAIEVVVPRLGWSMDEGVFVEWLKADGDWVNAGEMLFVVEGDKAAEEIESFDAGVLRIPGDAPQPGDEVRVGQLLAYLVAEGESAPALLRETAVSRRVSGSAPPAETRVSNEVQRQSPAMQKQHAVARAPVAITPRARRLARELGVTYVDLQGTGRDGRIRERDIRGLAMPGATAEASTLTGRCEPITGFRRTIAHRMLAGSQQAAPVTLTTKAEATKLVQLREQFRGQAAADGGPQPSYTDLLVKLSAAMLARHPGLKARWTEAGLFIPDRTHVAFAVQTNSGLVAPVIQDVPRKTLAQVAAAAQHLTGLARSGRLRANQQQDACFTVTNLGGYGIDAFTPILQVPQAAILGVGRIVREAVVTEDDAIVPREMITLSLTFDHRVLDGTPAAEFLNDLRLAIVEPGALLT